MPKVHFTLAAEATPAYVNQVKLCCWSIRHRGGALAAATISVVFNERADDQAAAWLGRELDVRTAVRDRISTSHRYVNKFNALYGPGVEEADWCIFLDSDTAVINDLEPLLAWMDRGVDRFGAVPETPRIAWGLDRVYRRFAGLTPGELEATRHPWFATDYPLFNAGFFAVGHDRLHEFRDNVIRLTRELFAYMRSTSLNPWHWLRVRWNRKVQKSPRADRLVIGPFYGKFYADQIALAAAVLKMRLPYRVLPHAYNWRMPGLGHGEESPIRILHYYGFKFPIDREHLFTGDFIDDYAESENEGERSLSALIREFGSQRGLISRTSSASCG